MQYFKNVLMPLTLYPLKTLILILIFASGSCPLMLSGQDTVKDIKALDDYIEQSRLQWDVPGMAVAVVKDGQVLLAKGYGIKKLHTNDKVDAKTIFNIGSTTKAITAFAMGILVDKGLVHWDDLIINHMPEFQLADAYMTRSMRVRDIFTHNLGLPNADYLWGIATHFSPEDILFQMRYLEPGYSIRAGYTYQNIMYLAAGQLIEKISGQTWEDFVQHEIFQPLGMTNSYPNKQRSLTASNRSTPHTYRYGTDEIIPIADFNADTIAPAGAIWSTIEDMSKWVVCVLDSSKHENGRLLQPHTWSEMFKPQAIIPHNQFYPTTQLTQPKWTTYSLGWFQHDYLGKAVEFHTGSLGGTIAQIGLIHSEGIGYYFLGNMDHAEVRHALMYKTFDVLMGQQERDWSTEIQSLYGPTPEKTKAAIKAREEQRLKNTKPSFDLKDYTGTFNSKVWGDITITYEDENLYVSPTPGKKYLLNHWHMDTFSADRTKDQSWATAFFQTVQFQVDGLGKVSTLNLGSPAYQFDKVNTH